MGEDHCHGTRSSSLCLLASDSAYHVTQVQRNDGVMVLSPSGLLQTLTSPLWLLQLYDDARCM